MTKNKFLNINNTSITLYNFNDNDYISLSDISKFKPGNRHIRNWIKSSKTIEFLKLWETLYNPKFDIKWTQLGPYKINSPNFSLSPKKWIETTNAIGLIFKSGRYGGIYGHLDIALEFAT